MSEQLAGSVKMLEAADFSEEMIREAKKHPSSARLHYSVQDATNLTYADASFDAVVISNALHIMPEPEKALAEIRRVLKQDGILFAPTFTAAESLLGRTMIHIMYHGAFWLSGLSQMDAAGISALFAGQRICRYGQGDPWRRSGTDLCRGKKEEK